MVAPFLCYIFCQQVDQSNRFLVKQCCSIVILLFAVATRRHNHFLHRFTNNATVVHLWGQSPWKQSPVLQELRQYRGHSWPSLWWFHFCVRVERGRLRVGRQTRCLTAAGTAKAHTHAEYLSGSNGRYRNTIFAPQRRGAACCVLPAGCYFAPCIFIPLEIGDF